VVLRGGAWNTNAANVRAGNRNANEPDNRWNNVGFRLARALVQMQALCPRPDTDPVRGAPARRDSANRFEAPVCW